MTDIQITSAAWRDAWWAAGQDFRLLLPLDPEFAALPAWRRFLLRALLLPLTYGKRSQAWIARREGRPLGYLYARVQGGVLLIDALGVVAQHQRRGIGRALMAEAARAAGVEGCALLGLPVAHENSAAQGFARALGFRPYRTHRWLLLSPPDIPHPKPAWRIAELPAAQTLPAYQRWQERALRSGMAWAAEALLQPPFARRDWVGYARHWVCFRGKEERAYLRIAGLRGDYRAYLACQVADLKSEAPLGWLAQALQTYTADFRRLHLALPTAAHTQAAQAVFSAAGLQPLPRTRLLMLRRP